MPVISIHALREEGDAWSMTSSTSTSNFYPRPPRGGRQKTLTFSKKYDNFYPRPPRGGRLISPRKLASRARFLSTPSARRATPVKPKRRGDVKFLSTPSARRATLRYWRPRRIQQISIHALREEGDLAWRNSSTVRFNFYPRPPRGGRPGRWTGRPGGWKISIHALREEGDPLSGVASKVC